MRPRTSDERERVNVFMFRVEEKREDKGKMLPVDHSVSQVLQGHGFDHTWIQ